MNPTNNISVPFLFGEKEKRLVETRVWFSVFHTSHVLKIISHKSDKTFSVSLTYSVLSLLFHPSHFPLLGVLGCRASFDKASMTTVMSSLLWYSFTAGCSFKTMPLFQYAAVSHSTPPPPLLTSSWRCYWWHRSHHLPAYWLASQIISGISSNPDLI